MNKALVLLAVLLCAAFASAIETQINLNFAGLIPENNGGSDDDNEPEPEPEPEPEEPVVETIYGERVTPYGWGDIATFVTLEDGEVTAVGLEVGVANLELFPQLYNSPDPFAAPFWILDFPEEAAPTLFRSTNLGYNPYGHPAPGIFTFPHIDFHFFAISSAVVESIAPGICPNFTGNGVDAFVNCEMAARVMVPVDQKYWPEYYHWENQPVPFMGDHAVDPTDKAFTNPGSFDHHFIFTRLDGYIMGYEPMITTEFLTTREQDECWTIPRQPSVQVTSYYPSKYCVRLLPEKAAVAVTLEDFEYRERS